LLPSGHAAGKMYSSSPETSLTDNRQHKVYRSSVFQYRRHWDGLQLFLADGRVEMHSNAIENLARPIALSRKNALFAGLDEGAAAWGRIASLIKTAKLARAEPYA